MIRIRHIMEYFLCSRTDTFGSAATARFLCGIEIPSKDFVQNELILEFPTKSMPPADPHSQTVRPRSSALELHPHTIIPRLDIGRQLGPQFGVVEIAVHVGEDRALRADAVDPAKRQVEVKVARMRPVP